ncbi:hypothetical protein ZWY2020_029477 [Hordeum vulgare]|nr:hypothetical protein ZWY2020_029477 [Hordeum vulgare]
MASTHYLPGSPYPLPLTAAKSPCSHPITASRWPPPPPGASGCKIYGQTATTDHHSELTKIGIIPSLKGPRADQKVPYVIFCAPPYRTDDYPGDLRSSCFLVVKGTVDARPDLIISMIHYEDAASLGIAIMKRRLRGRVFVGCDNQPLSRQEIMDRVNRSGNLTASLRASQGRRSIGEEDG